jgi:hypothetical protein
MIVKSLKKRIVPFLSMALSLCLLLSLFPSVIFAEARGIYSLDDSNGTCRDANIRNYSFVEGFIWRYRWTYMESKVNGVVTYDFSCVDHIISALESAGKKLSMDIFKEEPEYIRTDPNIQRWYDNEILNGDPGPVGWRPVPWEPKVLTALENFATALANHPVWSSSLGMNVPLKDHPTLAALSFGLPGAKTWIRDPGSADGPDLVDMDGYSRTNLLNAVFRSLHAATDNFPDKSVHIGFWKIKDDGADPQQELYEYVRQSVLAEFDGVTNPKVGFFQENLASAQAADFSDDFQDGDAAGWTPLGGTWSVTPQNKYEQSSTTAASPTSYTGVSTWADYAVEANVTPLSLGTSGQVGLSARFTDNANRYYFNYSQADGMLKIILKSGGNSTLLASKAYTIVPNTKYTFMAEALGSTLNLYVNGAKELTATDSTFSSGYIGMSTADASADFDDVNVYLHGDPNSTLVGKPTTAFAAPLYDSRNDTFIDFQMLHSWINPFKGADKTLYTLPSDAIEYAYDTYNSRYAEVYTEDLDYAYNNPSWDPALATWNDTMAQDFSDDFQDGDATGWTELGGTWSVTAGKAYEQSSTTAANPTSYTGNSSWADYAVEAKVTPLSLGTSGQVGLSARFTDNANRYYFDYAQTDGKLKIIVKSGGNSTLLASKAYTVNPNTQYTFKADLHGSTLDFYVNGVKELTTTDSTFTSGYIGLSTANASADFDDVNVTLH